MNGDFIPFLTNLDRLREKYPDKFKMKSGAGETNMNSRNKKNPGNTQKMGENIGYRRPKIPKAAEISKSLGKV